VEFHTVIVKNSKSPDGHVSNVPGARDSATSLLTKPNIHNLKVAKSECSLQPFHFPTGEERVIIFLAAIEAIWVLLVSLTSLELL
jgi:hypothetical protein